jgi:hypothetical protein
MAKLAPGAGLGVLTTLSLEQKSDDPLILSLAGDVLRRCPELSSEDQVTALIAVWDAARRSATQRDAARGALSRAIASTFLGVSRLASKDHNLSATEDVLDSFSLVAKPVVQKCLQCRGPLRQSRAGGKPPMFYRLGQPGAVGILYTATCDPCGIVYEVDGYQAKEHYGSSKGVKYLYKAELANEK